MKTITLVAAVLVSAVASAQSVVPAEKAVSHIVGTEPSLLGSWSGSGLRFDGAAFLNFQQQLGERGGDDELFSTNFVQMEARKTFGRSVVLGRVTGSAEPVTTNDAYPALFRVGTDREGASLVDEEAGQRFLTEVALTASTSLGSSGALFVYAAPIGVPAFGIAPLRQRASAVMMPHTTFSDDLYSFSGHATNVLTAGGMIGPFSLEGSRFDYGIGGDDFQADDDFGGMSVRAALTFGMARLQASVAEFDDLAESRRTNVGLTLARRGERSGVAVTLSATQAESDSGTDDETAFLGEVAWQFGRNNLSARVDSSDHVDGLFDPLEAPELAEEAHQLDAISFGYARDLYKRGVIVSLGFNLTYFQQPRTFEPYYGHKPQSTVFYVRIVPEKSRLTLVD